MRSVTVLQVRSAAIRDELRAAVELDPHLGASLGPLRWEVEPSFERDILAALRKRGIPVLVRYARRTVEEVQASQDDLGERTAAQPSAAQSLIHRAQRHARDGVVLGSRVWDPLFDRRSVQSLLGAGLILALPTELEAPWGPYHLHPDLPPPPAVSYDFDEAVMEETDDLGPPEASLVDLLHDLAALTAAMTRYPPRRTQAGTLDKATVRRLGGRLASKVMAKHGDLADEPRWDRALRALEALKSVSMDPIKRTLTVEPGVEETLSGTTAEAIDRLVHRLVPPDLQAAIPSVRQALRQARDGAVDALVFSELLGEQHRDVLYAPWHRDGIDVYPAGPDDAALPFDDEHFERVEGRMIEALLRLLHRFGLIRRADGVFAPTTDGRLWAVGTPAARPPVWVTSDLGVTVPPHSITPWERYQLERLGRCTSRDVVDVYTLEREGLETWLATHDLSQAIELLERRCPALPATVRTTLTAWNESAMRITLTRGVLLDP